MNKEWQLDAIKLFRTGVVSDREISKIVKKPRSTVNDLLRKYRENFEITSADVIVSNKVQEDVEKNRRILFISDMHIPYHHKNLIPFLKSLKEKYNPTRIICLGDETDKHALSFHDSDPDLMSAGDELRAAIPIIQELHELFPEMDLVDSS